MYQFIEEKKYRQEAFRIAESIIPYEIKENHGIEYPGTGLLRISADFATGSAGIGTFYKRLISNKDRIYYD